MATILVVDDCELFRSLINEVLSPDHFVIEASNGKEGLSLFTTHYPDLVLTDLNMPVMAGKDFLRHLRVLARNWSVKIAMISSDYDEFGEPEEILELGADLYLSKFMG